MKNHNPYVAFGPVVLIVVLAVGWYLLAAKPITTTNPPVATSTPVSSVTTSAGITFGYPTDFAVATTPDQVLVSSYIPACDQGFDYCVYFNNPKYVDTNFESAGIRVKNRTDLTTQTACLTTPPDGYPDMIPQTQEGDAGPTNSALYYATSLFSPIGDAGAGHYASGAVYRLFWGSHSTCTEFATRIGETQFANYPAGTKIEFSAADRASVQAALQSVLGSVTIGGSAVSFPAVQ